MPKATKKTKSKQTDRALNSQEIAQILHNVPEIAEMFSQADLQLAIDDRGWISGIPMQLAVLTEQQRQVMLTKCRVYRRDDPLAKQAIRLWTDYSFGDTGVCYEVPDPNSADAEDDDSATPPAKGAKEAVSTVPTSNDTDTTDFTATQSKLDKFWNHPRNKVFTSAAGQQRLSKKLLTDGDLFFAFFDLNDTKIMRLVKSEQVTRIITDPEDDERVIAYKRKDAGNNTFYYRDAMLTEDDDLYNDIQDPDTKKTIADFEDAVVLHVAFDQVDGPWGNSLLSAAVDWSKEHRRFMAARIALLESLAKFAWKMTAKGGKATLQSIGATLESTMVKQGAVNGEKNPQMAPGGTRLQNSATDLAPMPRATGAGDAKTDSDIIKLLVCSATGIMQHYFGDPSTGNLATATAMELPMLKQFQGYQQLWKDVWRMIFSVVLGENLSYDVEPAQIDIDMPPILDEDLAKLGPFLAQLTTVFPEAKVDAVLAIALKFLGIDDVDEVMDAIEDKRDELAQQAKEQAALMAKNPQFVQGVPANQTPEQAQAAAKAQKTNESLLEALVELNKKL